MSNTLWTPGPWSIDGGIIVAVRVGRCVAVMPPNETKDQDARLIAAAPDLVEALERFVAWDDSETARQPDFYGRIELYRDAIQSARAALAKARGEG